MRPKASRAVSTIASMSALLVTLHFLESAFTSYFSKISAATLATASPSMSVTSTLAPASASISAVQRPMPPPPPVTMAFLPSREIATPTVNILSV